MIDPGTAATFATLVGLLADFTAHRQSNKSATLDEFTAWLAERRHDEIVSLLRTTSGAAIGTKALLNETRDELLAKLSKIESALVQFASAVDGFAPLASALSPSLGLSTQAVDILRQIDAAKASKVLEHHSFDGIGLLFLDGEINGALTISDSRFLEDDIRTLVELGLLRADRNKSGGRFFHFTRRASELLRTA